MEMVSKNYESLLDRKRKRETLHLGSHSNILFPPSTMRTLFIDRFLIVQVGVSPWNIRSCAAIALSFLYRQSDTGK